MPTNMTATKLQPHHFRANLLIIKHLAPCLCPVLKKILNLSRKVLKINHLQEWHAVNHSHIAIMTL